MRLFLCEKPSQARDIARVIGAGQRSEGFLKGEGCVVTWGFGHLLEQAPPEQYDPALKRWSLEALPILPSTWKMEIKKSGRKQFGVVKKLLGQATEVVVATDADREGETIAREILDHCGSRPWMMPRSARPWPASGPARRPTRYIWLGSGVAGPIGWSG